MQGCQQENHKTKGAGMSRWLKEWCTLWVLHGAKHVFVLCYFPFSCLPSLCAAIKSKRRVKATNCWKLCCRLRQRTLNSQEELGMNAGHKWCGSIFPVHMVHKLPLYLHKSESLFVSQLETKGKVCGFDPFARGGNIDTVPPDTYINP